MITYLLNFFAPDSCLLCGDEGGLLCYGCRLSMEPIPSRCFYCQKATNDFDTCEKCRKNTNIKRLYVVSEYKNTAKQLISTLKFKSKRQSSLPIASMIAEQLPYLAEDTLIVNLPTAPQRVRQRGFDHTWHIAREVAKQKGVKAERVLRRKDNHRQVGSTRKQRIEQSKDSYRVAKPERIKGKNIILIDDVATTGASLSSAIKELKNAGAKNVHTAVLAYSK